MLGAEDWQKMPIQALSRGKMQQSWEVPGMLLAGVAECRAILPCSRFAVLAGIAAGCYHHKPPAIFISSKQMQSLPLNRYKML